MTLSIILVTLRSCVESNIWRQKATTGGNNFIDQLTPIPITSLLRNSSTLEKLTVDVCGFSDADIRKHTQRNVSRNWTQLIGFSRLFPRATRFITDTADEGVSRLIPRLYVFQGLACLFHRWFPFDLWKSLTMGMKWKESLQAQDTHEQDLAQWTRQLLENYAIQCNHVCKSEFSTTFPVCIQAVRAEPRWRDETWADWRMRI